RVDTTRGLRAVTACLRSIDRTDKGVELKRLMSEVGVFDRSIEATMPRGEAVEVDLGQKKWWIFRQTVGRVRAVCIAPCRTLLEERTPLPLRKTEVEKLVAQLAPAGGKVLPTTVVLFSTSGFAAEAHDLAERGAERTVILVEPNDAGGFSVYGPAETATINELFDPEAEEEKRSRIRQAIAAGAMELSGSGVASDRVAAKTQLPAQMVEAELRSYAAQHAGLVAKRLDGRLVLFREGSAAMNSKPSAAGVDMPMIDKIKSLFARRGETEKKIAFLSERRAALGQQRDRAYEEIAGIEVRDAELRQNFKDAPSELVKRRITSQLLQFRKEMERKQQLLTVVNNQINVVSTHLHNLELVQQGQTAKLPDSEEMASDAAAAEEMMATLQESSEMAATVGGVATAGMSDEEQALFEELERESGAADVIEEPKMSQGIAGATQTPAGQRIIPPTSAAPERDRDRKARGEPEAG
ncbi:MAG: hypothetical protein ABIP55_00660, partial [Tepidisphaeraceae bacterium]